MTQVNEMTPQHDIDRLVLATVRGSQAGVLTDQLTQEGFQITQVSSSGGIVQEATITLLIGLHHAHLERLLHHVRECCQKKRRFVATQVEAPMTEIQPMVIEAEFGGATVYVLEVERFEQL